jgi:predicted dithiol-disulfide oxidoreductase (DUF899 family)
VALPNEVSPEAWLAARKELLEREKELTRVRDRLNADRRRLPMVRVEKDYVFDGPQGRVNLVELFDGCRQLILQHFMFDPDWEDGCPSCSELADELAPGLFEHLRARQTAFAAVSRAPLAKIESYKERRGWTFPWYSSFGSEFNYDFYATVDDSVAEPVVNYRTRSEWREEGKSNYWAETEGSHEVPGFSCFLRDGDDVFHTYSTFARGGEVLGGGYAFLDLTALGRQEDWEEPKGRSADPRGAVPDFAT